MKSAWLGLTAIMVSASTALADFADVVIPINSKLAIGTLLQGEVKYNPGGTVTVRHNLGTLHFTKDQISKYYDIPSFASQYQREIGKARDAAGAMTAARWALKHGLLPQFYAAVDKALEYDPQFQDAIRVKKLKQLIDQGLPNDWSQEEADLRKVVRIPRMKVKTSKHFILLYDTSDTPPPSPNKKTIKELPARADARLELLEMVYESFLLRFYSQGVELEIPKERLKVVLFDQEQDYQHFATSLSPSLSSAIGFFDPSINISFFYNHATSERFEDLREIASRLQAQRDDFLRARDGDGIRLADTMWLLVAIEQENSDIEVVSHECTHHMAANTGLLPRHVMIPKWVHEGLATYFEAPYEATWSGMGAVNEQRLEWYNGLQGDREHSSLEFVIGDEIFSLAGSHRAILHGYGQGWALTHFLLERHFDEFMRFYRKLGEMPPDICFTPEMLHDVFDEAFDTELPALESEWKSYMRGLRTDKEIYLNEGTPGFR